MYASERAGWAVENGCAVRVAGLTKTYREGEHAVAALRGIDLEVASGELLAVMGPSGSGKSTLLHLLGGLDVPDAGSIVIGGRALGAMTDDERTVFRRRHVGIVFQSSNLVPTLTVEENVGLPLRLDGASARTLRARVERALADVGMAHRRGHRPDRLSGGERQRAAVARALAIDPMLILADEPTGSLDSHAAAEVLRLLRAASERRRAVIMVTHDSGAAAYAHRVVHVVDGRLVDRDTPTEIVGGARRCALGAS